MQNKIPNIYLVTGSWSDDSICSRLAEHLKSVASTKDVDMVESLPLHEFPLFSRDCEASPPDTIKAEKVTLAESSHVCIITPVYNSLVPGSVFNFMDWMSRPWGDSPLSGKSVTVCTVGGSAKRGNMLAIKRALETIGARVRKDFSSGPHLTGPLSDSDLEACAVEILIHAGVLSEVEIRRPTTEIRWFTRR